MIESDVDYKYAGYVPCISCINSAIDTDYIKRTIIKLGAVNSGDGNDSLVFAYKGKSYVLRETRYESLDLYCSILSSGNDLLASVFDPSHRYPGKAFLLEDDELARLVFTGTWGGSVSGLKSGESYPLNLASLVTVKLREIQKNQRPPSTAVFDVDYTCLVDFLSDYLSASDKQPFQKQSDLTRFVPLNRRHIMRDGHVIFLTPSYNNILGGIRSSIECLERIELLSYFGTDDYRLLHADEKGKEQLEELIRRHQENPNDAQDDKKKLPEEPTLLQKMNPLRWLGWKQ